LIFDLLGIELHMFFIYSVSGLINWS
jgi:hypothetical protein